MRARRRVSRVGVTLEASERGARGGRAVGGLAGRHGGGQPGTGAVQPLGADRGQLFAPLPQVKRLLEGEPARLEPLHHAGELVSGLLVREGFTISHSKNPTRDPRWRSVGLRRTEWSAGHRPRPPWPTGPPPRRRPGRWNSRGGGWRRGRARAAGRGCARRRRPLWPGPSRATGGRAG